MISPETEEKIRAHWAASVPQQYRCVGHDRGGSNHAVGAIIAPAPPAAMLTQFFASLGPQHLAADQRHAQEMREKQGKRGRKLTPTPKPERAPQARPSCARPKPSSPSLPNSALAAIADTQVRLRRGCSEADAVANIKK